MTPSDSVPQQEQAEALAAVRRQVAELDRAVSVLRQRYGDTLGVRRLRQDVQRLAEDLAELGPPAAAVRAPAQGQPLQVVPDAEYDPALWVDAEDEGLGGARP